MKVLHPWLRALLDIGSFLVLIAGVQLFLLTEHTNVYFAWTIPSHLSAATLGAFYWGTMVFGFLSARETLWAKARAAIPAVMAFTTITLIVSLLHFDDFQFSSTDPITLAVTWMWFLIYTIEPPVLIILFILQLRQPGGDPVRTHLLPIWFRIVLVLQGLFAIGQAIVLFVMPQAIIPLWPWTLTEYTAGALSAWFFAIGVIGIQAAWENDWDRIKIAMISYVIFSVLEFIAVGRYSTEIRWFTSSEINYLLFLLSFLGIGTYGWLQTQRAEQ